MKSRVLGKDLVKYMDEGKVSAEYLAKKLNCSINLVQTWRRKQNRENEISEQFQESVFGLIHWKNEYNKNLLSFIDEHAKSIVFWSFLQNTDIKEEPFVEPLFYKLNDEDRLLSFKEMILSWSNESLNGKLITSNPGSGKTTFVKNAIKYLININSGLTPILVPLGLYSAYHKSCRGEGITFDGFLLYVNKSISVTPEYTNFLTEEISNNNAVLFLDGIDEIHPDHRDSFRNELLEDLKLKSNLKKTILTGRILNPIESYAYQRHFSLYRMIPFNNSQVIALAKELLSDFEFKDFTTVITDNPTLKYITSLPLTLVIMLTSFRFGKVVTFTEASVLEFFFDFIMGKYKGARSLGGYIARDFGLTLDSPSHIRSTLYNACYKIREKNPIGNHFKLSEFAYYIKQFWIDKNFIREENVEDEIKGFLEYIIQLGIITIIRESDSYEGRGYSLNVIGSDSMQFSSELVVDWMCAAYLLENRKLIHEEFKKLTNSPIPIVYSKKRQLFYAFELLNANYGGPDEVNNIIDELYDSCKPSTQGMNSIEGLLHHNFLFVVDCLTRGLISSFKLKQKIQKEFRVLFENNHFALLQKSMQTRINILRPNQERNIENEKDYINVFFNNTYFRYWKPTEDKKWVDVIFNKIKTELNSERSNDFFPKSWTDEQKYSWMTNLLKERYFEILESNDPPIYISDDIEEFILDTSWRYAPSIKFLSIVLETISADIKNPDIHHQHQFTIRRLTFATRFIPIEKETKSDIEKFLTNLLDWAESLQIYHDIYKHMVFDSFWYLLNQIRRKVSFDESDELSKIPIKEFYKQYFKIAKEHKYFREKYTSNDKWKIEELLNDEKAIAHYINVEHDSLDEKIKNIPSSYFIELLKELESFHNRLIHDRIDEENIDVDLGRMVKICLILAFSSESNYENKETLKNTLIGLVTAKVKERHKLNVGPRQLYDYAIFSLWIMYETEEANIDILGF